MVLTNTPYLQSPPGSKIIETDVGAIIGVFTLATLGIWWRHGGLTELSGSFVRSATAIDQVSGLLCSETGILGLILITRTPVLERKYGLDRLFDWHRILGGLMTIFLLLHVVFSLAAWSTPAGFHSAFLSLTGREPYMAMATIGTVVVLIVAFSSMKWIRNTMSYEIWYFLHLTVYIGLALSFSHQIVLGADFATDSLARLFWIYLHIAVIVWILLSRWGRFALAWSNPLRVKSVTREAHGVFSLVLTSPRLFKHKALPGQFYLLRQRMPGRCWQANPFSLSARPTEDGLRFTIKARGEASEAMTRIRVGTRVVAEGPYGVCTPDLVDGEKVVLVAGGVGIGPIVSILEGLPSSSEPIVLYRAHSKKEIAHIEQIEDLVKERNGTVYTIIGARATLKVKDPFAETVLKRLIPDIATRVVILAGPESMVKAAQRGSRRAGVPAERIHSERAWW